MKSACYINLFYFSLLSICTTLQIQAVLGCAVFYKYMHVCLYVHDYLLLNFTQCNQKQCIMCIYLTN